MTPATTPRSILLVEDDPIHVEIIRFHLQSQAGRVGELTTCTRFEEALERVREEAPDLILLDLTLPDSDLDETLDRIPEIVASGANVVAMSSLGTPEIEVKARARGARAFIAKRDLAARGLGHLLDLMDADAAASGAAASIAAASEPIGAGTEARPPGDTTLAARLAHSANSWLTNQTFRHAALDAVGDALTSDPASRAALRTHVASLRQSTEALADIVELARAVLLDDHAVLRDDHAVLRDDHAVLRDETAPAAPEPVDLGRWLADFVAGHPDVGEAHGLHLEPFAAPLEVAADRAGLAVVFESLLADTKVLPGPGGGGLRIELRAGAVHVTGTGLGMRDRFGWLRARRWMERMAGALEVVERPDVRGVASLRLTFAPA